MIYEVAVIYDGVARAYLPPVFVSNRDVALRGFANAANDINHQIGRNPVDFSMFILGTWDDEQSKFVLLPERISLGLAASFVRIPAGVRDTEMIYPIGGQRVQSAKS